MRRVILESPFAARNAEDAERNERYARACMRDCLNRDEAPFASHLLYPQILNDRDAMERHIGILAGQAWGLKADLIAVYNDLGISEGMRVSLAVYGREGIPIEHRKLPGWDRSCDRCGEPLEPTEAGPDHIDCQFGDP
jgi:hypothetical protein